MERVMPTFDLNRPLAALDQDGTLIAVIEMRQSRWLVGGWVPGLEPAAPRRRAI
jgi:transposase